MIGKVVIGMSGGVDSAVAALLLKQQGYEVIAVTLSLFAYTTEDSGGCCSFNDTIDATKVCTMLGIEHLVISRRNKFLAEVIKPYILGSANGTTPNPCVSCNNTIKIPSLVDIANHIGAQYVATGHYSRIVGGKIAKGLDESKDQSYFLWELCSKDILDRLLFPLGNMTKTQVRAIAAENNLPLASKHDSMNLCFLEGKSKEEFLSEHGVGTTSAEVVEQTTNKVLLKNHKGLNGYTPGQRLGGYASSDGKPRFVLKVLPETNQVIVGLKEDLAATNIKLDKIVLSKSINPDSPIFAVCRYKNSQVQIRSLNSDSIELLSPVYGIAPGQSVVFYQDDMVVGGGIIV